MWKNHWGGLKALEYNYFLSQFAYGMVGLFGVLFVYQLGISWWQGLWLMLLFYGLQRVVTIVAAPLVGTLLSRFGYRRVMGISLLCLVGKLIVLALVEKIGLNWLFLGAICGGLYLAGYHVSFEAIFLDDNDDRRIGEQIGILTMLQRMALVVSPFLAGILVQNYSFTTMFWVAIGFLTVSIIPLWLMPHHKHLAKAYSLPKVIKFIERQPRMAGAVYFMNAALAVSDFFWPIFLLTLVSGYALLGAITSIVMLVSSVLVLVMGRVYDRRTMKRGYLLITGITALFWILRFLSQTVMVAAAADLVGRFFSPMWWMKVRRYELQLGERIESTVFGVAHMIIESLGALTTLILGVWLLVIFHNMWVVLAVVASMGILISGWLVRKE